MGLSPPFFAYHPKLAAEKIQLLQLPTKLNKINGNQIPVTYAINQVGSRFFFSIVWFR
jgi:hypothetical protein